MGGSVCARAVRGWARLWLGLSAALPLLVGCGTPGAPLPPSLRLAEPVADLAAVRTGGAVTLSWTNPQKTTDGVRIASFQAEMEADLCRVEGATAALAADCAPVKKLSVKPGSATTVTDALPPELTTGSVRALRYGVVLRNRRGRTAGVSNVAVSAAGVAPQAVTGLTAKATADGVVLRWQADGSTTPVRLHRHVERRAAQSKKDSETASGMTEAVDEDLMVDAPTTVGQAGAVDREARFDEAYSYTAERVERLSRAALAQAGQVAPTGAGAQQATKQAAKPRGKVRRAPLRHGAEPAAEATAQDAIEVGSPVSAAVTVETTDRFPPAIPLDVVATYTGATHSVDLSWAPDTEPDLAGYVIYRCADGEGNWTRISPREPVELPVYSDATAQAGRVYRYAVSAVDEHGNESRRSQAVRVSTEP